MFAQASQSSEPSEPSDSSDKPIEPIAPIHPDEQPPLDRYCDVVLQGGVVDGVVYPGLLVELARKFRFRSVGGTSVGAIAACLAVACEYRRRFNNSPEGFNEGLAKLPQKLSEYVDDKNTVTRIRSLFQPEPELRPLFDFLVDCLEAPDDEPLQKSTVYKSLLTWRTAVLAWKHFGPSSWGYVCLITTALTICMGLWSTYRLLGGQPVFNFVDYLSQVQLGILVLPVMFGFSYLVLRYLIFPVCKIYQQLKCISRLPGYGMCTGLSPDGHKPALIEWLYKGVQDAAGMPYSRPLTFSDLWQAPCGPEPAYAGQKVKSLDLTVISSCLSHGRLYEFPSKDPTARLFFKLSEFAKYFPKEIIDYLRQVAKKADKFEDNIRELPSGDLPIVVAARMSFAVPILFQAVPLLGLDLEQDPKDSRLVRLWFSDGGISSNMPVQLFDKALPRWPTFAARILNNSPKTDSKRGRPFVAYSHVINRDDALLDTSDQSAYTRLNPALSQDWGAFGRFILGIYDTAINGNDKAFFRAPEVRGRLVKIYINNKTRGALNLKLSAKSILQLGCETGVAAGQKLANVYLAQVPDPKYAWVNGWHDQRWVRMHTLINGLRDYLKGFGYAVNKPFDGYGLLQQIQNAVNTAPLAAQHPAFKDRLTPEQAQELTRAVIAIADLEKTLTHLTLPQPYVPSPPSSLNFKPKT